jgi:hypothetical protein
MLEVGGTRLANGSRSKSVAKPSARSRVSNGKDLFLDVAPRPSGSSRSIASPCPAYPGSGSGAAAIKATTIRSNTTRMATPSYRPVSTADRSP